MTPEAIMEALEIRDMTSHELTEQFGGSSGAIKAHLYKLRKAGRVWSLGRIAGRHAATYTLTRPKPRCFAEIMGEWRPRDMGMEMKLSKTQQDLYDAMRAGVKVHRADDQLPTYMRMDTQASCTAAAKGLIRLGIAHVADYYLRIAEPAK